MRGLWLVYYTMREMLVQRVILLLVAVLTVVIGIFIFTIHFKATSGVIETVSIYGSRPTALTGYSPYLADIFIGFIFTATVVLCIIATAHVIPEFLTNGTVELFLSRPISRHAILFARYFGVVLGTMLIQLYLIAACWVVFSLKVGAWDVLFPLSVLPLSLAFSSIYVWVVLLGVYFRSTSLSATAAFLYVVFLGELLASQGKSVHSFGEADILHKLIVLLYYVLPQAADLRECAAQLLKGQPIAFYPLILALFSSASIFGVAALRFRRSDF